MKSLGSKKKRGGAAWVAASLVVGAMGGMGETAAQSSRPAVERAKPSSRPVGQTTKGGSPSLGGGREAKTGGAERPASGQENAATSRPEASPGAVAALLASYMWLLERGAMKDKWLAAEGLGEMGLQALPAMGLLQKALVSKDKTLREKAAGALMRMGSHAKRAYPAVARLLNDEGSRVRMFAGEIFRRAGKEALPALEEVFLDKTSDPTLRMSILEALGRLGAQAEGMIPRVAGALQDPDRLVRQQAAKTLGDIGGTQASALMQGRFATKGLETDPYVRIYLLQSLARLHDPKALPLFKQALADPSALVRREAQRLLQQARR